MRKIQNIQLQIGEMDIAKIKISLNSRDDIPPLLRGLQYIHTTPAIREKVFKILEEITPEDVDSENGRPGMNLWKIFVLGTLRLNLNWDYDRLCEMGNQHQTIRQMLGHGILDDMKEYKLQTLKDNVPLLTVEILDKINKIVVDAGHDLLKKRDEKLKGRCDSYVAKTDVHFPTDINLLFDAIRKVITLTAQICFNIDISGWRQYANNLRKVKALFTKANKLKPLFTNPDNKKPLTAKQKEKKKKREEAIKKAYEEYIKIVNEYLEDVKLTLAMSGAKPSASKIETIQEFIKDAERQIDQIERRVLKGEEIPHDEKVFSLFEKHTEWINKGKAGVLVELGMRVCILEDQFGFILHHQVMEKQTDDQIAISMVKEAQERFPSLILCSFDKGFHSPDNQEGLSEILESVVLPRKGKLSKKNKEIEYSEDFISARHQHSAVESAINALQVHGLDKCPDHGKDAFKRYVALGIVARNVQKLGTVLQAKEKAALKRQQKKAA